MPGADAAALATAAVAVTCVRVATNKEKLAFVMNFALIEYVDLLHYACVCMGGVL